MKTIIIGIIALLSIMCRLLGVSKENSGCLWDDDSEK